MRTVCPVGSVNVGPGQRLAIIAGPCVLESLELGIEIGSLLHAVCGPLGLSYIFKASFDKANRTSLASPRGPGLERGLEWLSIIREKLGVPVTTDIHDPAQADAVAQRVDLLQIPAFLCRQTDLLQACGSAARTHGRAVNIKKGQFLSPAEMVGPLGKIAETGCDDAIITERGTFFGYHRLVNDFIGLGDLLDPPSPQPRVPVCFDVTHSTQLPGASATTGGRPERAPLLARAATAAGVDALFVECHPEPANAMSDASTMLGLKDLPELLADIARIRAALAK